VNVGFLLLADHSEALNGKVYAMGAGWNVLRFPQLPQQWAFGLALGVDVPWDKTNQRHALTMHIEDPDGELLGDEFSMEFEAGRPPGSIQGSDQRIVLSLRTQAEFATAGPHAVVVRVADAEIGRSRFYVVEAPMEMEPPQSPGMPPAES
jgi:hypothetical protein